MPHRQQIGSWIWDIRTGAEQWSDAQYDLLGYRPRAIAPTYDTFKQALHPDDKEHVLAMVAASLKGQATYRIGCRIIRPDGDVVRVLCAGDVVRDSKGRAVRMAGTMARVRQCEERRRMVLSSDLHSAVRRVSIISGLSVEQIAQLAISEKYRKAS